MTPTSGSTERPAEVEAKPLTARMRIMRLTERSRAGAGTGFEVMGFRGAGSRGLTSPGGRGRDGERRPGEELRPDRRSAPLNRRPLLAETCGQWRRMRHIVCRLSTLAAGMMKAVPATAIWLRAMGTAGSGPGHEALVTRLSIVHSHRRT